MRTSILYLVIATQVSLVSSQFLTIFEPASTIISGRNISYNSPTPSMLPNIQTSDTYDPNKPADHSTSQKYREKGIFLLCLLNATDEEAGKAWPDPNKRTPASASSLFKGTLEKDMEFWYWLSAPSDPDVFATFSDGDGDQLSKIGTALKELGLSDQPSEKGGQNTAYTIQHFDENVVQRVALQLYTGPDNKLHVAPGARYQFVVNQPGGAFFAQQLHNPSHAARYWWNRDVFADELPALRLASDIISAYWLRGNSNTKNLKYYFVNNVLNEDTLGLIAAVLNNKTVNEVPTWPGVKLSVGKDEGAEVLLGSPMGATLAYILIQHKEELGVKTVSDVHIFRDNSKDEAPNVQLLFIIKDVAPATEHDRTGDGSKGLELRGNERNIVRTHIILPRGGVI